MSGIHLFLVERTMTPLRSSMVLALALGAAGCHANPVSNIPVTPSAAIHFVNAVPDTMQQDMRVVDRVSNSGLFDADFRTFDRFYKGIEAGSREIKIFLSSIDPTITSQFIADTTFAFTQDQNYTFIHTGFARTALQPPVRTIWIIQDNPPTPGAGQIGVRFIHAGSGMAPVDVRMVRKGSDTLPDAPLFGNVAYGPTPTTYTLVQHDSFTVAVNGAVTIYDTLRVVVTAAGTKTPALFTAVLAPLGTPGTGTTNPIPGAAISGTAMTVILVPASVAGSMAPQTAAFTVPTVLYLVDKRPPNTAP